MQSVLLIGAGGALGALGRYGVGVLVGRFWQGPLPLATLTVNIVGSLAMGLLIGFLARTVPAWQGDVRLFAAVGLLGGFTTFSAFSLDAVTLIERGQGGLALFYVLLSVIASILALFAGLMLMRGGA